MKWIGISLAFVALLVAGVAVYSHSIANPRVAAKLRSSPNNELARKVMLLTLPSGRDLPVNYLREGDTVYAGADGPWWRALRGEGAKVELLVMGEALKGRATAIENDPARTDEVFARLRPGVPSWLPGWLNGVLVVIEIAPADR